jgi:hypothetical protein
MSSGAVAEAPAGARESAPGGGAAGAAAASVAAAALGAPVAAGAALPDVLRAAAIDPGLVSVMRETGRRLGTWEPLPCLFTRGVTCGGAPKEY